MKIVEISKERYYELLKNPHFMRYSVKPDGNYHTLPDGRILLGEGGGQKFVANKLGETYEELTMEKLN